MAPRSLLKAYSSASVESLAHGGRSSELVVALYDGVLDSIGQAELFMERGEYLDCGRACARALSILAGLRETLDFESGEPVATSLLRFYNAITSKILGAQTRRDITWLREAKASFAYVRDAWAEVAARENVRSKAVTAGTADTRKASAAALSGAGVAAAV